MIQNVFPFNNSVFYPGSGHDYRAIRAFVHTGRDYSFIQVDYGIHQDEIRERLHREGLRLLSSEDLADIALGLWGDEAPKTLHNLRTSPDYELTSLENIHLETLFPSSSENHLNQVPERPKIDPYALWGCFQIRDGHYLEKSWPKRFQVLFLGTEAISTYDCLFCQEGQQAPKAVVIQPGMHIGGNNWAPLYALGQETDRLPEYLLLVDPGSVPWEGYAHVEGNLWRRIG